LLDRDRDGFDARSLGVPDVNAIDIVAGVVVLSVIDFVEQLDARGDAVHLRLGI
jgi:hypothetical protein